MGFFDFLRKKKKPETNPGENETGLEFSEPVGKLEVEKAYEMIGVGTVAVVKILEGTLKTGGVVKSGNKTFTVKSMEIAHQQVDSVSQGGEAGILIKGASKQDLSLGQVLEFC